MNQKKKKESNLYKSVTVVVVTNYHILNDLRQHKFITLQYWRSKIQTHRA